MNWLDKIPAIMDTIKQSARVLFVASCLLLFLPQKYLALIGLDNWVVMYRSWLGILLLVSFLVVLGEVFNWAQKRYRVGQIFSNGKQRLRNLTPEEKEILRGYIEDNTKTQKLDMLSGVVNGLVQENVIYQASPIGEILGGCDYNIQPWAWNYLQKNKHLLE